MLMWSNLVLAAGLALLGAANHVAMLFAAWCDGVLVGTVTLGLDMAENQMHRAEVRMLLVAPGARRRGIARILLGAVEAAARDAGREMLVLDTLAQGGAEGEAEPLFRAEGWGQLGIISDYARRADGTSEAAAFFWKRL